MASQASSGSVERLRSAVDPSGPTPQQLATLAFRGAQLRLDGATAELFGLFEDRGINALLLKGPSIARWLYPEGARTYLDIDLLVRPSDLGAAGRALASLSYLQVFDDRRMPAWWREHAGVWVRPADEATVDLHRTLPGCRADDILVWAALSRAPAEVTVAGYPAPTPAMVARALHVVLHAAHHGRDWAQPIADLERLLSIATDELWDDVARLARELDADDASTAGLSLTSRGADVARQLGLGPVQSVGPRLRAESAPPSALVFEQLAGAGTTRARMQIVWRKLVPPASFIRHWDPSVGASRSRLLGAYVRRPFWVARRAPDAFRTWRRARRATPNRV